MKTFRVVLFLAVALCGCDAAIVASSDGVPVGTPTAVSALIADSARMDKSTWPASVPRDFVLTPHGFMHQDCLVQLGVGEAKEFVDGRDVIRHVDGTLTDVSPCAHPHFDYAGTSYAPGSGPPARPNVVNGYAYDVDRYTAGSDVGYVRSAFYVPGASTAGTGAIQFYIFNGVQGIHDLYQPLLINHGDSSWSYQASLYSSGSGYYGPSFSVSSGDHVRPAISHLSTGPHSESMTWWTGSAWRVLGSTSFTGVDSVCDDAIFGAGETYFVSACSQYPAPVSGGDTFDQFLTCLGAGCANTATAPSSVTLTVCSQNACNSSCSTSNWQWHQ